MDIREVRNRHGGILCGVNSELDGPELSQAAAPEEDQSVRLVARGMLEHFFFIGVNM